MCHVNTGTGPMPATWLYTAMPSSLSQATPSSHSHRRLPRDPSLVATTHSACVCARADGWVRLRAGVRLQVQEAWGYTIASTEPLP